MSKNKESFEKYCKYLGQDPITKATGLFDDFEVYVIINENKFYSEVLTYSSGAGGDCLFLEILLNNHLEFFKNSKDLKKRFHQFRDDTADQKREFKKEFQYVKVFFKCLNKDTISKDEIDILINNKEKLTESGIQTILPFII